MKIIPAQPGWWVEAYDERVADVPTYSRHPVVAWQFQARSEGGVIGMPLVLYAGPVWTRVVSLADNQDVGLSVAGVYHEAYAPEPDPEPS